MPKVLNYTSRVYGTVWGKMLVVIKTLYSTDFSMKINLINSAQMTEKHKNDSCNKYNKHISNRNKNKVVATRATTISAASTATPKSTPRQNNISYNYNDVDANKQQDLE